MVCDGCGRKSPTYGHLDSWSDDKLLDALQEMRERMGFVTVKIAKRYVDLCPICHNEL